MNLAYEPPKRVPVTQLVALGYQLYALTADGRVWLGVPSAEEPFAIARWREQPLPVAFTRSE